MLMLPTCVVAVLLPPLPVLGLLPPPGGPGGPVVPGGPGGPGTDGGGGTTTVGDGREGTGGRRLGDGGNGPKLIGEGNCSPVLMPLGTGGSWVCSMAVPASVGEKNACVHICRSAHLLGDWWGYLESTQPDGGCPLLRCPVHFWRAAALPHRPVTVWSVCGCVGNDYPTRSLDTHLR